MSKEIDLFKHEDKIRKAFNAGHETIVIQDRKFKMRRMDKNRTFEVTTADKVKESRQQTESWIVVSPVRGRFPMASIELVHQGNMRTVQVR